MEKEFFTTEELAKRYGVTRLTILNNVKSGKFPKGVQIGRIHRWNAQVIDAWERSQEQQGEIIDA